MTYDLTDPRSTLVPASGGPLSAERVALPALFEFRSENAWPDPDKPIWLIRAQNFVLEYSILQAGETVSAPEDPDEGVALTVSDDAHASVAWAGQQVDLRGRALAVIPPGATTITAHTALHLVRLYTTTLRDRTDAASNAADYVEPHSYVTPLTPWPAPAGAPVLRAYRVADFPPQPGRFGNIFRTRAFMINFLAVGEGPRDPNALSPHVHDDFEQISLAAAGEFVHHIRTPWTPRRTEWVDDIHWHTAAPSVAIIPPPTVHTSEAVGAATNALIDIFSPPRLDFSAKPGWVLNADDYPMPANSDGVAAR